MGMQAGKLIQGRGGRIAGAGLTDQQREFVRLYVANGGNGTEAATHAGYAGGRVEAWRLRQNPRIQEAIKQEQAEIIGGELASLSVGVLREILTAPTGEGGVSHKLKLDAAKTVLDRAGHVAPKAQDASNPASMSDLHRMSIEELEAFLDRAKHDAAERAQPVIEGQATHDESPKAPDDDGEVIDLIDDDTV